MPRPPALVSLLGLRPWLVSAWDWLEATVAERWRRDRPDAAIGFTATLAAEVTTAEIGTAPIETTPIQTAPPETEPAPSVTTSEPETTPVETEQPGEEQPVEPTASTSDTPWGWIIFGVLLATALVGTIVTWRRRQTGSAAWSRQMADLTQRSFVLVDDVLAQDLSSRATCTRSPPERRRSNPSTRRSLQSAAGAFARSSRSLRPHSRPTALCGLVTTAERGATLISTAVIRQQVREPQSVLRPPPSTPT